MNARQQRTWLLDLLATWFDLRERQPSAIWIPQNVVIPPEVSPTHHGPFKPYLFPLASIVYDWFDDPQWRELVIVKSSQAGISQAFQNLSCYIAAHQLGDIMWLFESATKAKQINRERLTPMLRAQQFLESIIPQDDDLMQNFILFLKGLKMIMAGAQSASQNASRTVPNVFCDEGDEYPLELSGGESHAWTLIRERAKLMERAKIALFSKPRADIKPELMEMRLRNRKKKDDGIVWKEFLGGTRHRCLIPCTNENCSTPFEIVWELIKFKHLQNKSGTWDFDRVKAETVIECPTCKHRMTDDDKVNQILKHRQWKQTYFGTDADNPLQPNRMSAHISDLYVNSRAFPTLGIGELAVKCALAKTDSDRKAFRRGNLALPTQAKVVEKATLKKIMDMAGGFPKGTLPRKPTVAFFGIDVQQHGNVFRWAKVAFEDVSFDEPLLDPCWVFDYGETDMHSELLAEFNAPIPIMNSAGSPTGESVTCDFAWIDEGDGLSLRTVLDLLLTPGFVGRMSTTKGRAGKQTTHMPDRFDRQDNRFHRGREVFRYNFDTEYFMDELHETRFGCRAEIVEALLKGVTPPAGLIEFCSDPDPAFCEEFCNESKGWHLREGKSVWGWPLKPENGGRNEGSDIVRMCLGAWFHTKQILVKMKLRAATEAARDEAEKKP